MRISLQQPVQKGGAAPKMKKGGVWIAARSNWQIYLNLKRFRHLNFHLKVRYTTIPNGIKTKYK
jgi:hypothetical protein